MAEKSIVSSALSCWRMKNQLETRNIAGRNCCNSITLWLILFTNLDYVMNKCQPLVTRRLMLSVTEWWLCAWAFCRNIFLVVQYAYTRLFCVFFGVVSVDIFLLVNEIMLTSLGEYLSSNCFEWLSLVRFTQLWVIAIFEHKHFTR